MKTFSLIKYVLADKNNQGILCIGKSLPIITYLKMGLIDTEIKPFFNNHEIFDWSNNNSILDHHIKVSDLGKVTSLETASIDDYFTARKTLANARYSVLIKILAMAEMFGNKFDFIFNNSADSVIFDLIKNPQSPEFFEYSQLRGLPVDECFKELELKINSRKSQLIKTQALIDNFVEKVTLEENLEKLKKIPDEFKYKLFLSVDL
jgi:hypothetical protein